MKRVAVIYFPGTNCEHETVRALQRANLDAVLFKWNDPAEELTTFDGFVIPGGFSYQDRVRAGAIAAKHPIIKTIMKEAEGKKPVLGICNGAQILVEAGMVPGIPWGAVTMALASNRPRAGYLCRWVHVKRTRHTAFTSFSESVIPLPIAHGEGRFTTTDPAIVDYMDELVCLAYCESNGERADTFPVNPNGSLQGAAAIANPEGNVMAMMPHPERAACISHIPTYGTLYSGMKHNAWGKNGVMESDGPGMLIFHSMRSYLEKR